MLRTRRSACAASYRLATNSPTLSNRSAGFFDSARSIAAAAFRGTRARSAIGIIGRSVWPRTTEARSVGRPERMLAREQLVRDERQAVLIRPRVRHVSAQHLGRHVHQRPDDARAVARLHQRRSSSPIGPVIFARPKSSTRGDVVRPS